MTARAPQPLPSPSDYGSMSQPAQGLGERVLELEAERARLERAVAALKAEQRELLERFAGLEEQSSTVTTLYVACQRLHSQLSRREVLLAVRELISNLIGCEEYALFSLASDGALHRVASFGLDSGALERLDARTGLIGRTVRTGEIYLRPESDGVEAAPHESNLTACIPLQREGIVVGAIALFHLLPQKPGFQELDRELFGLLKTHLATALYCADLHEGAKTRNGAAA